VLFGTRQKHLLAMQRCLVDISGEAAAAASKQQAVSFPIDVHVLRPCTSNLNRIDSHKAVTS
jgi:hypothetical protein